MKKSDVPPFSAAEINLLHSHDENQLVFTDNIDQTFHELITDQSVKVIGHCPTLKPISREKLSK